jgi:hypothetical protein
MIASVLGNDDFAAKLLGVARQRPHRKHPSMLNAAASTIGYPRGN